MQIENYHVGEARRTTGKADEGTRSNAGFEGAYADRWLVFADRR